MLISELRYRLNIRREQRKRLRQAQALFAVLIVALVYLLVATAEAPGKDLAELTADQRAAVVGRWGGQ